MNCYKGVCIFRQDKTELCEKDREEGKEPKKCDMVKEGQGHRCRHGLVGCKDCYRYAYCTET